MLSALADEHRRAVIRELAHTGGTEMAFETLTDHVAAQVRNEDAGESTEYHRSRVRIALHHTHLPNLESFGLISYDTERMQVESDPGAVEPDLLTIVTAIDGSE